MHQLTNITWQLEAPGTGVMHDPESLTHKLGIFFLHIFSPAADLWLTLVINTGNLNHAAAQPRVSYGMASYY